jgi:hypothetical protein
MTRAAEGVARQLTARCYAGLDAGSLQAEVLDGLQRIVSFDAAFCATVDPATLLFTGAVLRDIPWESTPRFLANEFLEDDVNKFRLLAAARSPVDWLDRATQQHRTSSARYREIMAPLGLGDELRAAFRAGGACWGFLSCTARTVPAGSHHRRRSSSLACRIMSAKDSVAVCWRPPPRRTSIRTDLVSSWLPKMARS